MSVAAIPPKEAQDWRPFAISEEAYNLLESVMKSLEMIEHMADDTARNAVISTELLGHFLGLANANIRSVIESAVYLPSEGA